MIPAFLHSSRAASAESIEVDQDHWISYSDLMAGLLMVFALLLLTSLYSYRENIHGIRETLELREEVTSTLQRTFGESGIDGIEVGADGGVRFPDQVLFAENSAVLSVTGREQLRTFARQYIAMIFGNPDFAPFREQLEAIVVEGHTNDNGTYGYNLRLSQERAYAVMDVLFSEADAFEMDLQRSVTANGRSFAALVCNDGTVDRWNSVSEERRCRDRGGVDKERSRRIDIRFQLRDGDLLQDLLDRLER